MAGGLSFTPVQDIKKPTAMPATKTARNAKSQKTQAQPSASTGNNEVQITDNDDECIVTIMKPRSENEERLLAYMPALFNTSLPPCGLEPQVAYETLVARLRTRWLQHRGRRPIVDICEDERLELERLESIWPVFSLKGPKKARKPWRREMVFKFELQWIIYFVDEAKKQSLQLMTESELMDRRKYSAVPKGLKIHIAKQHLLKLWETWNEIKRAPVPAIPDDLLARLAEEEEKEKERTAAKDVEDAKSGEHSDNNSNSKLNSLSESSDISIVHRPSFEGKKDDEAHLWSQGNHD